MLTIWQRALHQQERTVPICQDQIDNLTLPAGKLEHIVQDGRIPGFGVRLRGDGVRITASSYIFQYRIGKKQRRLTIGWTSALSVDAAREIARRFYRDVKLYARDPQGERFGNLNKRMQLHAAEQEVAALEARILGLRKRINAQHV